MSPDFLPLFIASPLLIWMAVSDFRHMLIPNVLILGLLGVFAVSAPLFLDWHEIVLRLAIAGIVFTFFLIAFVFHLFAGGDVKAMGALMLFVPTTTLSTFALTFSAAMMIGIGLTLGLRMFLGSPASRFVTLATTRGFPMGISISLAGLLLPFSSSL